MNEHRKDSSRESVIEESPIGQDLQRFVVASSSSTISMSPVLFSLSFNLTSLSLSQGVDGDK